MSSAGVLGFAFTGSATLRNMGRIPFIVASQLEFKDYLESSALISKLRPREIKSR